MRRGLLLVLAGASASLLPFSAGAVEGTAPQIVSRIPRTPVESSGLAAVGYSEKLRALEVEFVNGAIYRHDGVPSEMYRQLMSAQSKARFYVCNIRGVYPSVRVKVAARGASARVALEPVRSL